MLLNDLKYLFCRNSAAILCIMLVCILSSCKMKAQKILPEAVLEVAASDFVFTGTWLNVEILKRNRDALLSDRVDLRNKDRQTFLAFRNENNVLKVSKISVSGSLKSSTAWGNAYVDGEYLVFFIDDIQYAEKLKIYSRDKFSLIQKDVEKGVLIEKEMFYQRQ